ncbi:membrane-associated zinc metalloprotease [Gemmatirosa kalamazoonensis]|uniref:Zinc metalloprotease n=1 Tax=Gemmatirosa kalamazoonensis TaxID=861299 RepID=W0RKH5_9BACT|nr:RIP metalloprotease RseP [Gemmatirosa kalamazoonensis]AHG90942.1 membrane-associated zinc metalloprotease [Gemmatirosa kalamazoonensis]
MLTLLAPIIVFGLVVFVHELGHFLAAKAVGVYAPRFSIGFGPALLRKRFGETEYVLAALPLGGYVRMASREDESMAFIEGGGEHPSDAVPTTGANAAGRAVDDHVGDPRLRKDWDPDALAPFGPHPVPEHRWFESKSLPARLLILLAGVTMNALLAIVMNTANVAAYGRPYLPAVIDSVLPGQPAAVAGLARGDSIIAVNGAPVRTWGDLLERVSQLPNSTVDFAIVRAGTPMHLSVSTRAQQVTDEITQERRTVGRVGIAPRAREMREHVGFGDALGDGWRATWYSAGAVVGVVRGLFAGRVAVSNLGGPIAIARTSVAAAKGGLEPLLALVAFLSINIAVLNLLPIPVLDGGQVLINVLEAIKGSAFSVRTREYILRAGLVAIALLFVTVMWNDLSRLLGDIFRR